MQPSGASLRPPPAHRLTPFSRSGLCGRYRLWRQTKGYLMPPLTPGRRSVQIGRTESAVGKLVPNSLRPCDRSLQDFHMDWPRHRHWTSNRSRMSVTRSVLSASVFSAKRKRGDHRSRPARRDFESERGLIPVGAIWPRGVPAAGELLFYFCQLIPCVSLLVFLLVSATIDDENYFKFKWL
jgi:hypothetical protein